MNYIEYMKDFSENRVAWKDKVVAWIRGWFEKNGPDCNVVIGISGGKDSTVAAALCVEALGKDRVKGLLMPDGVQADIQDSYNVVKHLDIDWYEVNIHNAAKAIMTPVFTNLDHITRQANLNLPPRVRMVYLYAFSQSLNGRVCCTCNASEDYIGWSTRWGDDCGDFAPLRNFTSEEVIELGRAMNLPEEMLIKPPADGLTDTTDEDNFGFTYAQLNEYIMTDDLEDKDIVQKIMEMHERNEFKMHMPAAFERPEDLSE